MEDFLIPIKLDLDKVSDQLKAIQKELELKIDTKKAKEELKQQDPAYARKLQRDERKQQPAPTFKQREMFRTEEPPKEPLRKAVTKPTEQTEKTFTERFLEDKKERETRPARKEAQARLDKAKLPEQQPPLIVRESKPPREPKEPKAPAEPRLEKPDKAELANAAYERRLLQQREKREKMELMYTKRYMREDSRKISTEKKYMEARQKASIMAAKTDAQRRKEEHKTLRKEGTPQGILSRGIDKLIKQTRLSTQATASFVGGALAGAAGAIMDQAIQAIARNAVKAKQDITLKWASSPEQIKRIQERIFNKYVVPATATEKERTVDKAQGLSKEEQNKMIIGGLEMRQYFTGTTDEIDKKVEDYISDMRKMMTTGRYSVEEVVEAAKASLAGEFEVIGGEANLYKRDTWDPVLAEGMKMASEEAKISEWRRLIDALPHAELSADRLNNAELKAQDDVQKLRDSFDDGVRKLAGQTLKSVQDLQKALEGVFNSSMAGFFTKLGEVITGNRPKSTREEREAWLNEQPSVLTGGTAGYGATRVITDKRTRREIWGPERSEAYLETGRDPEAR